MKMTLDDIFFYGLEREKVVSAVDWLLALGFWTAWFVAAPGIPDLRSGTLHYVLPLALLLATVWIVKAQSLKQIREFGWVWIVVNLVTAASLFAWAPLWERIASHVPFELFRISASTTGAILLGAAIIDLVWSAFRVWGRSGSS
jgi:hypothetical protein